MWSRYAASAVAFPRHQKAGLTTGVTTRFGRTIPRNSLVVWCPQRAGRKSTFMPGASSQSALRTGKSICLKPALETAPLPASFGRLGFDVVSRHSDATFECSPLSCNYMAREIPVNRYCLIETEAEAFQVARDFSRSEPEPGSYCLVEVWRADTDANSYSKGASEHW